MPWEGVLGIAEVLDIAEVEEGWDREGFEEDCWVVRESGAETGTLGGSRTISTKNKRNEPKRNYISLLAFWGLWRKELRRRICCSLRMDLN